MGKTGAMRVCVEGSFLGEGNSLSLGIWVGKYGACSAGHKAAVLGGLCGRGSCESRWRSVQGSPECLVLKSESV